MTKPIAGLPERETGASRELDAMIAERVFGWRWFTQPTHPAYLDRYGPRLRIIVPPDDYRIPQLSPDDPSVPNEGYDVLVPSYSTYIGDAFLVVEAMRAKGWWCDIKVRHDEDGSWYGVEFIRPDGSWGDFDMGHERETLPEAICLAALEALRAAPTPTQKRS